MLGMQCCQMSSSSTLEGGRAYTSELPITKKGKVGFGARSKTYRVLALMSADPTHAKPIMRLHNRMMTSTTNLIGAYGPLLGVVSSCILASTRTMICFRRGARRVVGGHIRTSIRSGNMKFGSAISAQYVSCATPGRKKSSQRMRDELDMCKTFPV